VRPGSLLLGEPSAYPSDRLVIVACPDCDWLEVIDRVPQSCPNDWRHRAPRMVRAWLYCAQGCWSGAGTDYRTCDGGPDHEVWIDPTRSSFL
jgi:hypothetical protein